MPAEACMGAAVPQALPNGGRCKKLLGDEEKVAETSGSKDCIQSHWERLRNLEV